jgi:hypothetical protein
MCGAQPYSQCDFQHATLSSFLATLPPMEFLLLWWDDLDDLTHMCRHLAASAFSEVAEYVSSLATEPTK